MKLLCLILGFSFAVHAKVFDQWGVNPYISFTKSVAPRYDLTILHWDVLTLGERNFQGRAYPRDWVQTYFQTALTFKYNSSWNFAIGHVYQMNNPNRDDYQNEHRIFPQVTYASSWRSTRFTQRLRVEERFVQDREKDVYHARTRVRFQTGMQFPLQGRTLDPGEYYFNTYNEFYFSALGERNAFWSDDWVYTGLGFQTKDWGRIEAGPIAQFSVVNRDKDIRQLTVLQVGWLLSL